MSYGSCILDKGSVPSCPYILVNRIDSVWSPSQKTNDGAKIVYLWRFTLTATKNVLYIDNAILNVTFSAPSIISQTHIYKVYVYIIYGGGGVGRLKKNNRLYYMVFTNTQHIL